MRASKRPSEPGAAGADAQRIAELFAEAFERPAHERRAFLDARCADAPSLRGEVEALLSAHERAGDFLDGLNAERGAELLRTQDAPQPSLAAGSRFSHYEILGELGRGGMGEVYLARDAALDRKVALKLPAATLFGSEEARRLFLREARLAAALEHPSICRIFELGESEGRDFIAMEYVEGETLAARLERGRLPVAEAVSRALEVVAALEEAHDKAIVHRDLKPANLMLGARGPLKVMDFGIAKRMSGTAQGSGVASSAGMVGTPAYMAPEQVRGERIDARADIFTLGVVLYEAVSGAHPFRRPSPIDTVAAILREPTQPLSTVRRDVPKTLEQIVERMLAKDPAKRPPSVRALREDLERALAEARGGDAPARSQSAARVAEAARRRPAAVAGLVSAAILLGLLAWNRLAPAVRSPRPRLMLAALPFENLSGDPEQEYLTDGFTEEMITELGRLQPDRLGVIARTSVMRYRKAPRDVGRISRELDVDFLLQGSVRGEKDRLRVSAQLVRASDQTQLWAERYDIPRADVLQVQEEVARAIAREIRLQLPAARDSAPRAARALLPEAHEAYLRGRHLVERRTAHDIARARELFERAVALDPGYAPAYVGLASSHILDTTYSDARADEAMPRARQALRQALELDERLAQAHAWMGSVLTEYDWDWKGAEASFRRALELDPNLAHTHKLYAEHLSYVGRHEEAVAEARVARRLDPLSIVANGLLGTVLYRARRFEEAIAQLRQTIELDPNHPLAYLPLGLACSLAGRHAEALSALEKGRVLSGDHAELVALVAYVSARAGRPESAEALRRDLARRAQRQYVSPFVMAVADTGLGRGDAALGWLEKGYAERIWLMCLLKTEPIFDPLRDEPRFRELLVRMKLAP
jgi:serine/threonine-protein kinase